MFQQSIPRLLTDSEIATYHWPFILIEHRLWPILVKCCISRLRTKGYATTSTIVQESTIFTINVQLSTIIVTIKKTVTIIVDNCTFIVEMVDSCTIVLVVAYPLLRTKHEN